ncbi:MAG: UDP-N-acetylmuramoyl-tripeptide--D-alanyl-D-alanine ligase [Actinobacteria bacterium]|nr:UDP-N-acetylmuramoyl-tripeptide--D-alanyl-D-alanine ligase [Actinomycetota bacterium]
MIPMTVREIAKIVGGSFEGEGSALITREPFFDSRKPIPGGIFLALKGENVDGHDYVSAAVAAGAITALTTRPVGEKCIVVADVLEAISKLSSEIRNRLPELTVIGITGSQGKTTTKDITRHVLSMVGETIAPEQSFNNDLGVPLTLLRATEKTQFCILEMGARHLGDIARLVKMARPNIGVVLVVGTAHIGEFGSRESIAETKSEIVANLEPGAIAILGTYDEFTPQMSKKTLASVLYFGEQNSCDIRATDIEIREGCAHFDLVTAAGREPVALRLIGRHQVPNALAAAAIATACELPLEKIVSGLSTAEVASKWRMEISERASVLLINDSYNANPESMRAALETLRYFAQERGGRAWAFLGRMHELGSSSDRDHRSITTYAEELEIDHVIAVKSGEYGSGSAPTNSIVQHVNSLEEALAISGEIEGGDVILVKGSRAEGLEKLSELIKSSLIERESSTEERQV